MTTRTDLPDPLVPVEVDLRGYGYMPLFGDRLFKSETWIGASTEAKVAALRLWWHAYAHEVPAASLPNNDVLLAEYAGYGVQVKAWKKIRPDVMRHFVECSDGRLYHDRLCVWAIEAWNKRVAERKKKAKWRAKNRGDDGDGTGTDTFQEPGQVPGHTGGQRRDGTVEAKVSEVKRSEANILDREVKQNPNEEAPASSGQIAVEKIGRSKANGNGSGQDWNNPEYVYATGRTRNVEQREGESFAEFRDRVYAANEEAVRQAQVQAARRKQADDLQAKAAG